MVIKIHQSVSTKNALFYNERKVEKHKASFFHCQNMPVLNPFLGDKNGRYRVFKEIEERNTRVKKKGLHISFNPTVSDLVKLEYSGIRTEIANLMEHLGYGNQPYFVYKHADLERVHFHIVSTRIDQQTGKKIKDSYEKEKTQWFIKGLEKKYQLTQDDKLEKQSFRFSASSKNLKQNMESLFTQLNRMDSITTKEIYDKSLELFNVEIRKSGRGHVVLVTGGEGKPIRYPIHLSKFKEKPNFYISESQSVIQNQIDKKSQKINESLKSVMIKELIWQVGKLANKEFFAKDRKYRIKRKRGKKK